MGARDSAIPLESPWFTTGLARECIATMSIIAFGSIMIVVGLGMGVLIALASNGDLGNK